MTLLAHLRDFETSPLERRPSAASELGQALRHELRSSVSLGWVGAEIAAIATRLGCDTVMAASTEGMPLATAAVLAGDERLMLYAPGCETNGVLVVDIVLYSGSQVARALRLLDGTDTRRAAVALVNASGQEAPLADVQFILN